MSLTKFTPADIPADENEKEKDSTSKDKKVEAKEEKKVGETDKKTGKPKVAKVFKPAVVKVQEAKAELEEVKKITTTNAYAGAIVSDAIDTLKKKAQPLVYEHHKKESVVKLGISLPKSIYDKIIKYAQRSHDKVSRVIAGLIEQFIPKDIADRELGGKK